MSEKELNLCDTCTVRIHEDKTPGCNLRIDAFTLSTYGKVIKCFRYNENKPISPHNAYEKSQRIIQGTVTGRSYIKSGDNVLEEIENTITFIEYHLEVVRRLLERLK